MLTEFSVTECQNFVRGARCLMWAVALRLRHGNLKIGHRLRSENVSLLNFPLENRFRGS